MRPKLGPLGDCGIRIEFGDEIRPAINTRIRRFLSALDADPIHGVTERAYGYAVVTVYYQPWVIDSETLCAALTERLQRSTNTQAAPSRQIDIPVCYGGEFGPDLEEVAAYHHLSSAQVIQKHCRPRYLVYFLGFLPGFAYLGGLPDSLTTPRRSTPRVSVSAGAVGIGGAQTGVYPCKTPGGWQIIGQTPLRLYEAGREMPALLAAGDWVKFVPISAEEFYKLQANGMESERLQSLVSSHSYMML